MRRVFDLGRILPPLCRPAPPPLLPDLFPDASALGGHRGAAPLRPRERRRPGAFRSGPREASVPGFSAAV